MKPSQQAFTPLVAVQLLLFVVVAPFLPLLISRRWQWWEAWVYAIVGVLGFGVSRLLAARRHPDLLAERARFMRHPDAKSWNRILAPLLGLGGAALPLVAGFDALLGWSAGFSLPLKIVALVSMLAGLALATYALMENRFFSGMVRIQTDRGHYVISSGPSRPPFARYASDRVTRIIDTRYGTDIYCQSYAACRGA